MTPQLVSNFKKRFGSTIAILHSRLSNGEKYDELKSLLCKILCEFVQTLEDFDEQIEDILINLLYHLITAYDNIQSPFSLKKSTSAAHI